MKKILIRDPMYFSRLTVMYGCSENDANDFIRRQHEDCDFECFDDEEGEDGGFTLLVERDIYMWLEDPLDAITPWLMGAIAHETQHAVAAWLRHIGMPISEETEEASTYLQQFYVERVTKKILLNALDKKRKKNNARWCKGSISGSEPAGLGSSPSWAARTSKRKSR